MRSTPFSMVNGNSGAGLLKAASPKSPFHGVCDPSTVRPPRGYVELIEFVSERHVIRAQIEDVRHPETDRAAANREQHHACAEQHCTDIKT
jgi:hypothetical protein